MKRLINAMAVFAMLVSPCLAVAQAEKAPEMDSATAAIMAEMAKYANPGPEHKTLEKRVGKWNLVTKMLMDPSQPPVESKGTCETVPLLGGRFFRTEYRGDFMGSVFEGITTEGYDLYKKQYVASWIDNMGTMMLCITGTGNADGSEITYRFEFDDPATKTLKKIRQVAKWTGADTWVLEWHEIGPDGNEYKTMDITHTRVK